MRKAFVMLMLAVVSQAAVAAGRVFFDGFEDGTTNAWTADDYRNKCQVVTTAADLQRGPYEGTYMARCNADGTAAWNSPQNHETMNAPTTGLSSANEIFYRLRIRVDANAGMTGGSAWKLVNVFYYNAPIYHQLFMSGYNGPWGQNCNVGAGCADQLLYGDEYCCGSSPNNSVTSSWHSVEYYINYTTGKIRVWNDDQLIRDDPPGGVNFGEGGKYPWWPLMPNSNWEDAHDAVNYIYIDNVETFTDTATGSVTGTMFNGDIQVGGTGSPPVMQSISCNPTSIQAPASTTCTAVATNTPTSYTWTGQGTNCTYSGTTASVSLTCSYGGARTPCATATNAYGTSAQMCVTANSIVWRYVKPSGFGAN